LPRRLVARIIETVMLLRLSSALALIGLSLDCGTSTSPDSLVPMGPWGGDHALLTVGVASAAIEFDCAHGTLPAPITLTHGGFDVAGEFVQEHGGPIREGEQVQRRPARYRGSIDKQTMTLRVALTDVPQDIGTFTLTFGVSGRVFKCL
jgi:hypothetical protein